MVKEFTTDVLVIGSGGAGLRAAIEAEARGADVIIVSKSPTGMKTASVVTNGWFRAAVGGVTKEEHYNATMAGGKDINDTALVKVMVEEGPSRIMELEKYGMALQTHNGMISCGDNPNSRGLGFILPMVNYLKERGVKLVENCLITKLLKVDGKVVGAVGLQDEPVVFKAKAVVLAAGGSGGLYTRTDVPISMTGDGYALAYEAGAVLRDMEFIQFLPVGLAEPGQPLIPVYGPVVEEGRIINVDGEDLVAKHNITARPLALMSRDLLSRALMREVAEGKGVDGAALIDATEVIKEHGMELFRNQGHRNVMEAVKVAERPIKVAPLCHFVMAGVRMTPDGETNVSGLYVAGEVAGGVHGANRIGGNAMTDIIVFGARAGAAATSYAEGASITDVSADPEIKRIQAKRGESEPEDLHGMLRELMWTHVGVVRGGETLNEALNMLAVLGEETDSSKGADTAAVKRLLEAEMAIMASVLTTKAALARKESRGTHFRLDYPESSDEWEMTLDMCKRGDAINVAKAPLTGAR
jgi:succinate dehydrogenase/fumarate reductase flavoprotein subunit